MTGGEAARPRLGVALGWSFSLNAGRRVTTTLVALVLAGLLGPAAFGTVAIATIYVLLVQLVFQQGFAPALIQRSELDDEALDVAFRLVMLGSLVMTGISWAASGSIGSLMDDEALPAVLRVLSLQLPVQALGLVQESLLRRSSAFRLLSIRTNVSVLAGGVAGVALVFLGAGVWSLVAQQLVTSVLATVLVWGRTGWRPRPGAAAPLRGRTSRELTSFASRTSLASVAQFGGAQVDSLLVGALFGATAVGLYRLAGRLVETVLDLGIRSLQSAFLPDLARQGGDAGAFRERVLQVQRIGCGLAMPPLGVLAGSSAALVQLLGDRWRPAAVPLLLLSLGSLGVVFTSLASPALQAAGRPGLFARLQLTSAALSALPLVIVAAALRSRSGDQINALALTRGVGSTLLVGLYVWVLHRALGLPRRRYVSTSGPGVVSALSATAAGWVVHTLLEGRLPRALDAGLTVTVATAVALGALTVLERDLARQVASALRARARRGGRTS